MRDRETTKRPIQERLLLQYVRRSEIPPILAVTLLSLSLIPALVSLSGAFGWPEAMARTLESAQGRELVHILLDSCVLVIAFVIGTLALVRLDSSPLSFVLAASMPFVVVLEALHLFAGPITGSSSIQLTRWTWTVSRLHLALALTASVATVIAARAWTRRQGNIVALGNLVLGSTAIALVLIAAPITSSWIGMGATALIPRPMELPPALLWIALLAILLPRLHRIAPSVLGHAAIVSTIPQLLCHFELAFGSVATWNVHFAWAHWQKLVALLALFVGIVLDSLRDREASKRAISDFESAQVDLERQTSELEILDERRIRELAASEAKFQSILDNASDLVQTVDSEGRFIYVNPAWRKTLGYSPAKLGEITWWDILHPDDHGEFRGLFTRALSGESFPGIEVVFLARGGREIYVEGNITVLASDAQPVAVQGIFRDITERKEAEAMKEAFISTVSHELRTPLTSIYGSLCLLDSGGIPHDQLPEFISVAIRNSERLLRLINDLLDLQRLAAGKTEFKIEPIEVLPILEEEVASMQSYAVGRGVHVIVDEASEACSCLADSERLAQVLANLLSNAVKFSPEGETVTVTVHDFYDRTRISVIDHGPGIPEEFQNRLFDEFTQLDHSSTRQTGGSGLGLSIARGMTERMGGSITFETNPSVGTTFHLDFLSSDG